MATHKEFCDEDECPDCGEPLDEPNYCPVCEWKWKDIKDKMPAAKRKRMLIDIEVKGTLAILRLARKQLRALAKALPNDDNYADIYSLLSMTDEYISNCFGQDGIMASVKYARRDAKSDQNPMPNHAKGYWK
jgi:hypothetical protein